MGLKYFKSIKTTSWLEYKMEQSKKNLQQYSLLHNIDLTTRVLSSQCFFYFWHLQLQLIMQIISIWTEIQKLHIHTFYFSKLYNKVFCQTFYIITCIKTFFHRIAFNHDLVTYHSSEHLYNYFHSHEQDRLVATLIWCAWW